MALIPKELRILSGYQKNNVTPSPLKEIRLDAVSSLKLSLSPHAPRSSGIFIIYLFRFKASLALTFDNWASGFSFMFFLIKLKRRVALASRWCSVDHLQNLITGRWFRIVCSCGIIMVGFMDVGHCWYLFWRTCSGEFDAHHVDFYAFGIVVMNCSTCDPNQTFRPYLFSAAQVINSIIRAE